MSEPASMGSIRALAYLGALLAGLYLIYCALVANSDVPAAIDTLIHQHFSGRRVEGIGNLVAGLLAGGHLMLVPLWQIRVALVAGWALCFVSVAGFYLASQGCGLRALFTREYWRTFEWR